MKTIRAAPTDHIGFNYITQETHVYSQAPDFTADAVALTIAPLPHTDSAGVDFIQLDSRIITFDPAVHLSPDEGYWIVLAPDERFGRFSTAPVRLLGRLTRAPRNFVDVKSRQPLSSFELLAVSS